MKILVGPKRGINFFIFNSPGMKHFIFMIGLLLQVTIAVAADTLIVHKDPRLDLLSAKQALINKYSAMLTGNGLYKGYRIQVISTSSREEAFKIKTELLTKFPGEKTYLLFQSPYFKVRIGNFVNREDADALRNQLNKIFSFTVYVVEDAVEYTPKEDDEINQ